VLDDGGLTSLELANQWRAMFAAAIGLSSLSLAIIFVVSGLNSLRAGVTRIGLPAKKSKNYRTKRMLRAYALLAAGVVLLVVAVFKLGATETWFALLDPASFSCLEAGREVLEGHCR
jgi:hypothetical protein